MSGVLCHYHLPNWLKSWRIGNHRPREHGLMSFRLLLGCIALAICVPSTDIRAQALGGSRIVLSLDSPWQFILDDPPGAEAVAFDDSAWSSVNLPHTWNNLDGEDGGNDYYRGVGWYRMHYQVSDDIAGRELFIKFDGANYWTTLFVNGMHVGEHIGGFSAFAWDLTPFLVSGDNVFAVQVTNAYNDGALPQTADITLDGGLFRHVNLIATDPLHISVTDYASPGIYLQQTNVSASSADLNVTSKLQNDGAASREITVVSTILDAAGNRVQVLKTDVSLDAGSALNVVQTTTLSQPHLWNGRSDPYLYHVSVQLLDVGTNQVVDEVVQPLGLRYFSLDPDQGFFLNGQPLDLHGVGFHQDRLDQGLAISDAEQEEDINLIREVGATFVRLVFYQRPPKTYDLLDAAGLVAWSEIPLIDTVLADQGYFDLAKLALRELIRQNYNHPSVFFWGLYNEIPDNPTSEQLVTELNDLAHSEDSTRLTTAATLLDDDKPINYFADVNGFNKYYGWYYGNYYDLSPWANLVHAAYPDRVIGVSEYGGGASIHQHQDNPRLPFYGANSGWHPEEYQNFLHEWMWNEVLDKSFLWCKSVWTMFDFAVDNRNEGDTPGRNDKGLVTYDRQTHKDAFYFYKANWSSDPALYIASRRYTNRPGTIADIKVYSNLDSVQLFINGELISEATSDNHIFLWPKVGLYLGANDVVVTATQNGSVYSDEVTWYTPYPLGGVPYARINFQPTTISPPPGFLADYGYPFGDQGNGFSYGWDSDNSQNAYLRDVAPGDDYPLYDSLIALQAPAGGRTWEIAVPNGTYDVHLVGGDPSYFDSIYGITVEGVLAASGGVNSSYPYQEAWRRVNVSDGRLTITSAAIGVKNNKLNFVEINQIP